MRFILILLTTLGICATECLSNPTTAPSIDPQAERVLEACAEVLGQCRSLSVNVTTKIIMAGGRFTDTTVESLVFQRPNSFANITLEGDGGNLACDGRQVIAHAPKLKKYTVANAPSDLAALKESPAFKLAPPTLGSLNLLEIAWSEEPYLVILKGVTSVSYLGEEQIDGLECHKLKFEQEGADAAVWVSAAEEKAVIRRIVPDLSEPLEDDEPTDIQMVIDFEEWKLDEPLPDKRFTFEPPDGATKVEQATDTP